MKEGICSTSNKSFLTGNEHIPDKCYYHRVSSGHRNSRNLDTIKNHIRDGLYCEMAVKHLMKLTHQLSQEIS